MNDSFEHNTLARMVRDQRDALMVQHEQLLAERDALLVRCAGLATSCEAATRTGLDLFAGARDEFNVLRLRYEEQRRRVRIAVSRLGVADCDDPFDALDAVVDDVRRLEREATDDANALRAERDVACADRDAAILRYAALEADTATAWAEVHFTYCTGCDTVERHARHSWVEWECTTCGK